MNGDEDEGEMEMRWMFGKEKVGITQMSVDYTESATIGERCLAWPFLIK